MHSEQTINQAEEDWIEQMKDIPGRGLHTVVTKINGCFKNLPTYDKAKWHETEVPAC